MKRPAPRFSTGLSLLARTSYFDDYIAKPAAEALMDAIVGDKLHNLMVDVLEQTPLKPYMSGLAPCARKTSGGGGGGGSGIGGHLDKLDPNVPANAKARQEWEAEHKDEILKDLQSVFETADKKPLSEEDFKKLVEAIKKANKTPEALKKMLEAARNAKSGKLDLDRAFANVERGVVPEDKLKGEKERKIDYEKAKRSNVYYQNAIGWEPTTFIKKPGIRADSKDFADAVYDMQDAIGEHPDGIAGPGTTVKFYQTNKLQKDKQYKKAVEVAAEEQRAREEKNAAKEKAAREKAAKPKAEAEGTRKGEGGDLVAIGVGKPPAGAPVWGDAYPHELQSSPGWFSIPYGTVTPRLGPGETYAKGQMLTVDVRYWVEKKWVWFTNIRGELTYMSSLNDVPLITIHVSDDFYFKLTDDAELTYIYSKGERSLFIEPA